MRSVLVVTDHLTHYLQESVYPISRCLAAKRDVRQTVVVSRGLFENANFFRGSERSFLGQLVSQDFFVGTWDWRKGLRAYCVDEFDIVFLRIDRPFDEDVAVGFKRAFSPCRKVFNNIDGVLSTRLKSFVAQFDQYVPPSRLCHDVNDVMWAIEEYGDVVLKPDDGYAAKGVVRIHNGMVSGFELSLPLGEYLSNISAMDSWPRVAVRFLPRITEGDKRLLIANGRLISCVLRVPQEGGWLVNYASGRLALPSSPTERELGIIDYVSEKMTGLGVFLYSIDTIEDDDGHRLISEINSLNAGLLSVGDGKNQATDSATIVDELMRITG